jgi:enoyl-CoA hydratase/carnithine racemase
MHPFRGKTLSFSFENAIFELRLHRTPCNEIGSATLMELEKFAEELEGHAARGKALVVHSTEAAGFSAGADLRELYSGLQSRSPAERNDGVRNFLERIHQVFNRIDGIPLVTVAADHGVVFGGGFELALTCDMIVADRTARFCFPELRLGLIPGFGGIPRLKRDLGNALVRDLLLTGRSINAGKAAAAGLVSQLVAPGHAVRAARGIATQATKFDSRAAREAKRFIKPIPRRELEQEIETFCALFDRPEVETALGKFVESSQIQPYLP